MALATKEAEGNTTGAGLPDMKRARILPMNVMVEVAPGQTMGDLPDGKIPLLGLVFWVPQGDGTYRPKYRISEPWVRMTVNMSEELGVGVDYHTLHRLGRAGFVEITQITPGVYTLNLRTLIDHRERCRQDPEFWAKPANLGKYREALA